LRFVDAKQLRECGSHFPLGVRQACLSGEERGNIDAERQNPLVLLYFLLIATSNFPQKVAFII